ncbi:MAG: 4-hydroxy-tetrahydrodipicolinate synthase [Clostridiales bacterium GWF2_38_85]|nr:MAG: 4-hydroxy-tetrahydrodipicolinate synthase [Clostridiales bacterium GWF2_38_85]HBL84201.1 4-hydroxy-tetrahydrodipicolinate synthase [Clostridiales bacterium]
MNKPIVFQGTATAMVTPFRNDEIDFISFGHLLERQTENGIDALVICGTTGEAATMSDCERLRVIEFAVRHSGAYVPIIAGTGSNSTAHAVELTKEAVEVGCDAALVVTPYYNKATQIGLVSHYTTIADASEVPIIIYNVPTRTGVNVEPKTYAELAEHPNIVAVKESGTNIVKIQEMLRLCGDKLTLYSGNDNQILPLLALGGMGVVSVLSNLLPASVSEICKEYFNGNNEKALKKQLELLPLMEEIFVEVNPIPIKTLMAQKGLCTNEVRLPLTEMEPKNKEKIIALVEKYSNL